jgi:hypothetical protein
MAFGINFGTNGIVPVEFLVSSNIIPLHQGLEKVLQHVDQAEDKPNYLLLSGLS